MGLLRLVLRPSLPEPRTSSFFRGVVGSWMTCLPFPEADMTTTLPLLISPFSVLNFDSRMLSNSASCSMVLLEMAGEVLELELSVMPRA